MAVCTSSFALCAPPSKQYYKSDAHGGRRAEPKNMAYMTRLGTQGYASMPDLIKNLIQAGLGASELYACALKAAGMYMGRCRVCWPLCPCFLQLREMLSTTCLLAACNAEKQLIALRAK